MNIMKIRKNCLPRRMVDILCFLLIGIFLPIVFIFEIIIVLPAVHESGGFLHNLTFLIAMFLVFNIKGNMIACMMIDTSVDCTSLRVPENAIEAHCWRHCNDCNRISPPRSWHCKICGTCILKRDHHCLFTGCCIGHRNHRYFLLFVFFLFIGSTYAFVYNSFYLWVINAHLYRNWLSVLKMTCPMLMLMTGSAWQNMYLVFYNLNILAVVYSIHMLVYHTPTALRGAVCYESGKNVDFNMGLRKNLESVFGKRMHLVWLSPLIKSDLPHNGIDWKANQPIEDTFLKKPR